MWGKKKKINCEKKLRLLDSFSTSKVNTEPPGTKDASIHAFADVYLCVLIRTHLHGCIHSSISEKVLSRKTSSLIPIFILMGTPYQSTIYKSSYCYLLPHAELAHRISAPRSAASTGAKHFVQHRGQQKNWYSGLDGRKHHS